MHADLLLARHAEAEDDRLGIVDGFGDYPLTVHGRRQARLLAVRLSREFQVDVLYCGKSTRTIETAEIVAERLQLDARVEDRLTALNIGLDPGITQEQAARKYPHVWSKPLDVHACLPGGETYATFHQRVTTALMDLVRSNEGSILCVITHGQIINAFHRHFCRYTMEMRHELSIKTSLASIHQFNFRDQSTFRIAKRQIVRIDDTSHLTGLSVDSADERA